MKKKEQKTNREVVEGPSDTRIEPLLLTRKEAAAVLGLKTATLRCWATTGRGPRYRKLHEGPRAPVRYAVSELRLYAEDPIAYEKTRNGRP
jgi:hypothetical protein